MCFHCTSHIRIRYRYYSTCNLNVSTNWTIYIYIYMKHGIASSELLPPGFLYVHRCSTYNYITYNKNISKYQTIRGINPSDRGTRYRYKCIRDNAVSILLLHCKSVRDWFFQSQPPGLRHGQPRLIPRWCHRFPKWDCLSLSNGSFEFWSQRQLKNTPITSMS